ncbi:MAG: HAMP domain-containing sensor histidine kinase [Kouleothrix sp.]
MVGHEYQPQLVTKQQQLRIRRPPLPYVLGDETRRQIAGNLLSNASKYTPPTGPDQHLSWHQATRVELAIEDNGVGISPDDQSYLFNAFFRARAAMAHPPAAPELGFISRGCWSSCTAGRSRFMSQPGQGSIFYVTFQTTDTVPAASVDWNMRPAGWARLPMKSDARCSTKRASAPLR